MNELALAVSQLLNQLGAVYAAMVVDSQVRDQDLADFDHALKMFGAAVVADGAQTAHHPLLQEPRLAELEASLAALRQQLVENSLPSPAPRAEQIRRSVAETMSLFGLPRDELGYCQLLWNEPRRAA